MDHIPVPAENRSHVNPVPYLGLAPKYDGLGFDGFPERCGMKTANLFQFSKKSPNDTKGYEGADIPDPEYIESLWQEWLWFGVLHEFEKACGVETDMSQFIRPATRGGSQVLSLKPLLHHVRLLFTDKLREHGVSLDLKVGELVYLRSTPELGLRRINEDLGGLRYTIQGPGNCVAPASLLVRPTEHTPRPDVDASLSDLGYISLQTICRHVRYLIHLGDVDLFEAPNRSQAYGNLSNAAAICITLETMQETILRPELWMSIQILMSHLESMMYEIFPGKAVIPQVGVHWPVFDKEMLTRNWCPTRIQWLKEVPVEIRYFASLLPSYEMTSHRECSSRVCSHRVVSLEQMQAKHRYEKCICGEIPFEETDPVHILQCGGIPGLAKINDPGVQDRYEIVDITGRNFIAISHVWAHGLGNPSRNSLPLCQIQFLFQLLSELGCSDSPLWIDTISVPVTPQHKRLALRKLRHVYRLAHKVLVVDRHLLQLGTGWLERGIQLRASEWMKRLWTLQEVRLASSLYIQFRDQAVSMSDLIEAPSDDIARWNETTLIDISDWYKETLKPFSTNDHDSEDRFIDLIKDLAFREVTVPTDEPLCIATLLGLDLDDFESNPDMTDIYRSLQELPKDLLVVPSPRLYMQGFRWAPSTFMNGSHPPTLDIGERKSSGTLNDMGFHIHTDCILLDKDPHFEVNPEYPAYLEIEGPGFDNLLVSMCPNHDFRPLKHYLNITILLHESLSGSTYLTLGVLVSDFKELESGYHCQYVEWLHICKKSLISKVEIRQMEMCTLPILQGRYLKQVCVCIS